MDIKHYIKQLLPLKYHTKYLKDSQRMGCDWQMWFGKPFNIKHYEIGDDEC